MKPVKGLQLIAFLLIAASITSIVSHLVHLAEPNDATSKLVSNVHRTFEPPRNGLPRRLEGGGTR